MFTFQRSHVYAVLLPLAFVTGLAVGYIFWGRTVAAPPAAVANPSPTAAPQQAADSGNTKLTRYDIPTDDDPAFGPEDAPITLIEFSDYECPFCRKWHTEVFPQLVEKYPDQIRFVYRDFPLTSIHSNAAMAAEAANCAGEQGQYWKYSELLFGETLGLNSEAYAGYADQISLDGTKFAECLETRRYQDEVEADYTYAAELGIRSTPTFFINGLAVVGAQPFEVFQTLIDQELASKAP